MRTFQLFVWRNTLLALVLIRGFGLVSTTYAETTLAPYTSFFGEEYQMIPYTGRNVAFLVPPPSLDSDVMAEVVAVFDDVYDYYAASTGREPGLYINYNGLPTIASVRATCGAGCAYLGLTGIEVLEDYFMLLYDGVHDRNEYDQVIFYEFGRNFWFYEGQLEYKGTDHKGSIATGFAVFMRDMAMEATAVNPGPFNDHDFSVLVAEVRGLLDTYLADPTLNWENTLRIGQAPPNSLGPGYREPLRILLV